MIYGIYLIHFNKHNYMIMGGGILVRFDFCGVITSLTPVEIMRLFCSHVRRLMQGIGLYLSHSVMT